MAGLLFELLNEQRDPVRGSIYDDPTSGGGGGGSGDDDGGSDGSDDPTDGGGDDSDDSGGGDNDSGSSSDGSISSVTIDDVTQVSTSSIRVTYTIDGLVLSTIAVDADVSINGVTQLGSKTDTRYMSNDSLEASTTVSIETPSTDGLTASVSIEDEEGNTADDSTGFTYDAPDDDGEDSDTDDGDGDDGGDNGGDDSESFDPTEAIELTHTTEESTVTVGEQIHGEAEFANTSDREIEVSYEITANDSEVATDTKTVAPGASRQERYLYTPESTDSVELCAVLVDASTV